MPCDEVGVGVSQNDGGDAQAVRFGIADVVVDVSLWIDDRSDPIRSDEVAELREASELVLANQEGAAFLLLKSDLRSRSLVSVRGCLGVARGMGGRGEEKNAGQAEEGSDGLCASHGEHGKRSIPGRKGTLRLPMRARGAARDSFRWRFF